MSPAADKESPRSGAAAATTVLCGLAALLFAPVLVGGETFFSRDIAPFFYPMKHYLAESVRSGGLPLWNPWIVNGEPFFASLQPGLLYPPNLLLYGLPLPLAFNLLLVLHYPLAGVGMYVLLRRWGHGWAGAVLGAVAFMVGGFYVSLGNFLNNLQAVAWTPWLLVAWDRVMMGRRPRDVTLFAVVCGAAFLGGEPQMLGIALLLLLVHGLLRVERRPAGRGGQLFAFALGGVLAICLVAVQFVPFVEYIGQSVRTLPIELEYSASRSLTPLGTLGVFVPPVLAGGAHGFTTRYLPASEVPWLLSVYVGVVVLLYAALGVFLRRGRRWALFWTVTAALGILLALGSYSPLFKALFGWIPPLRAFRYPEKFFLLTAVAVPVMAAQGFDSWLGRFRDAGTESRRLDRATWSLLVAALLAYGATALIMVADEGVLATACGGWLEGALLCSDSAEAQRLYALQSLVPIALIAVLAAVQALLRAGRLRPAAAAWLVLACCAGDLMIAHRVVNPSVPSDIYTTPPWTAKVLDRADAGPEEYRFRGSPHIAAMGSIVTVQGAWELTNMYLDYQTMGPNVGQMFGHPMQDGLQGVELQSVALTNEAAMRAWAVDPLRFLQAMNVRYYADATVEADAMTSLRLIESNPELPIRVFEVPDPLPRVYLVPRYELAAGPEEALRRTLDETFVLGAAVVLEQEPALKPAPKARGEVLERAFETNRVRLRIRTSGPMLLVLNDRFYPGWTATLLGHRLPILRANGVFRAVAVPGGEREVVFEYAPASIRIGAWISLATLLLLLGVYRLSRRRAG
jgi:hypothetical protein